MRTLGARLVAGSIAAGLVLSGCGGSPEPAPMPKPGKSSAPPASATPSPPAMPQAARAKTDQAVEAFARHYVDVINYTARSGDRHLIDLLSTKTCASCMSIAGRAAKTYAGGGYIHGDGWSVPRANVVPNQPRSLVIVELTLMQRPETVLTKSGSAPKTYPGGEHTFNMAVTRISSSWKVARLDLVA